MSAHNDPVLDRTDALVRNGDLSQLTFKSIMKTLESEFGADVKERKAAIRGLVNNLIEELNNNQESSGESEATAPESSDSECSDHKERKPVRPKRKSIKVSTRASSKRAATGSGIQKAIGISAALREFLGVSDEKMARTEVTKRMIQYVKENSLQSPNDGRKIICDERLQNLLGVQEMTFFSLQKVLSPHFEKSTSSARVKSSSGSGGNAFHRPYAMSDSLQVLLGTSEPMSRPQIVKNLWIYIKSKDLQNPDDKRFIQCDESMKAVFKTDNLHMMKMNKILTDHISPAEPSDTKQDKKPVVVKFENQGSSAHDIGGAQADIGPNPEIHVKTEPDVKVKSEN